MASSADRLFFNPVMMGLSLTGIGFVAMYYYLNKQDEPLKPKSNSNSSKLQVPKRYIPLIIGRGGLTLKEIEIYTNTKIKFEEEKDIDSPNRTCLIYGTPQNIKLAEIKIREIIHNETLIETYEINVDYEIVEKLLEHHGKLFHAIQRLTNTSIILSSDATATADANKARIIIKGTAEKIADAINRIGDLKRTEIEVIEDKLELKEEEKCIPKDEVKLEEQWRPNLEGIKFEKNSEFSALLNTSASQSSLQSKTDAFSPSFEINLEPELVFRDSKNQFIEVMVSSIVNPSLFYVQKVGQGIKDLEQLTKEMTTYYSSRHNQKTHTLKNISVGEIVAAKFHVDNRWYRAEVTECLENGNYDVFYIDYGDEEVILPTEIFEINSNFLHLKVQATECCLLNVKPISENGTWSEEAVDEFATITRVAQEKKLSAKFRGYKERPLSHSLHRHSRRAGPIPCIELWDKKNRKNYDLGKELIKRKVALPEDSPKLLSAKAVSELTLGSSGKNSAISTTTLSISSRNKIVEEISLTDSPMQKPKVIAEIDLVSPERSDRATTSRHIYTNNKNIGFKEDPTKNAKKKFNFSYQQKTAVLQNVLPAGEESDYASDEFEMC